MIKQTAISKDERFYLESKGFKMHEHIMPTYTKYRHYFCIETSNVLKCLEKYRDSKIIDNK